jgi:hypothetical protein
MTYALRIMIRCWLFSNMVSVKGDEYQCISFMVLGSALPKDRLVERPPGTYRIASSYMALACCNSRTSASSDAAYWVGAKWGV